MKRRSVILALPLAALTAGCAVGVKQEYGAAKTDLVARSNAINLAVLDRRPYVLDNSKPETFTGLSRGGFGNPFDVNTASGQPLASDMASSLQASLAGNGAKVTIVTLPPATGDADAAQKLAAGGAKGLLIVLREWKSDTYMTTALLYEVDALVFDAKGSVVARNTISGRDELGSGLEVRNTAPVTAFGAKMKQLLSAPQIAGAL